MYKKYLLSTVVFSVIAHACYAANSQEPLDDARSSPSSISQFSVNTNTDNLFSEAEIEKVMRRPFSDNTNKPQKILKKRRSVNTTMSDEQTVAIIQLFGEGKKTSEILNIFKENISVNSIQNFYIRVYKVYIDDNGIFNWEKYNSPKSEPLKEGNPLYNQVIERINKGEKPFFIAKKLNEIEGVHVDTMKIEYIVKSLKGKKYPVLNNVNTLKSPTNNKSLNFSVTDLHNSNSTIEISAGVAGKPAETTNIIVARQESNTTSQLVSALIMLGNSFNSDDSLKN